MQNSAPPHGHHLKDLSTGRGFGLKALLKIGMTSAGEGRLTSASGLFCLFWSFSWGGHCTAFDSVPCPNLLPKGATSRFLWYYISHSSIKLLGMEEGYRPRAKPKFVVDGDDELAELAKLWVPMSSVRVPEKKSATVKTPVMTIPEEAPVEDIPREDASVETPAEASDDHGVPQQSLPNKRTPEEVAAFIQSLRMKKQEAAAPVKGEKDVEITSS